jgi:hypothetical protein
VCVCVCVCVCVLFMFRTFVCQPPVYSCMCATSRVAAAGLTGGRVNAFNITKQSKVGFVGGKV